MRESAHIVNVWTPVVMSHRTIGTIVKKVGQAQADERLVDGLEIADYLPEGKKVNFKYAQAGGVLVRGTKQKEIS